MAPSSPITPGENAHSALLTSSSIVTPIIITFSSAAGISLVLFLAIVGMTSYRRFRARQAAEERRKSVPQLVITDTSMFPACNMVVNGDADLDKVIASYKPLGKDSHADDEREEIAVQDAHYARPYDVEKEEQLFCLPPKPRPALVVHNQCTEPPHHENGEATQRDTGSPWDPKECSPQLDETEINQAVFWWHEFNTAFTHVSTDSLSEADDSVSSGSLYSSNSLYHGPSPFKQSAFPSSATLSVLNRITGANSIPADMAHRRKSITLDPIEEEGNESQETLYDKDVLEYCWRLSNDGIYGAPNNSRSTQRKQVDDKTVSPEIPARRKSRSEAYSSTNDPIDQRILEYCWRLSDSPSGKSIRDRAVVGSKKRRSMTTIRSASESSISKSAALHTNEPPDYASVVRNNRI